MEDNHNPLSLDYFNCLGEFAMSMMYSGNDEFKTVDEQVEYYRDSGFPMRFVRQNDLGRPTIALSLVNDPDVVIEYFDNMKDARAFVKKYQIDLQEDDDVGSKEHEGTPEVETESN